MALLRSHDRRGHAYSHVHAYDQAYIHASKGSRSGLAVAYCRYPRQNVQTVKFILGSILAQVYNRDEESYKLPKCVLKSYHGQKWVSPQMVQLEEWLQARSQVGTPLFVLLDAIDELDTLLTRELLRILQSCNLKLLVTSREMPSLRQEFHSCLEIPIRATKSNLHTMILARPKRESTQESRRCVLDQPARGPFFLSVKEEAATRILQSTNQMFLVAALHLNRILACNSVNEVYRYLDRFPTGLNKIYDQAWERATSDKESLRSQNARMILMWVSVAFEPLSVATLMEALSASRRKPGAATLITEEEIVSACAGLVRIEHRAFSSSKSYPVISFSHLSVRSYFDKNWHLYFPDAADEILVSSLYRLSSKYLYMVLSPLCGAYLYLTLFSIILSEVYDHGHDYKCGWLTPEVVDFAILLVFDVLISARFKYVPIDPMPLAPIPRQSTLQALQGSQAPVSYFHQNLRQHLVNAHTKTQAKVVLSLLFSRWPLVVEFGTWATISRCSPFLGRLAETYGRTPFALGKLIFCALLCRNLLHESAGSQRPSFQRCPIIVTRMLMWRPQALQDMKSLPIAVTMVVGFLILQLAPICYEFQREYAAWPRTRRDKVYPLPFD